MTFLIFLALGTFILGIGIGLVIAARQIMSAIRGSYEDELEAVLAQNLDRAIRNLEGNGG